MSNSNHYLNKIEENEVERNQSVPLIYVCNGNFFWFKLKVEPRSADCILLGRDIETVKLGDAVG